MHIVNLYFPLFLGWIFSRRDPVYNSSGVHLALTTGRNFWFSWCHT